MASKIGFVGAGFVGSTAAYAMVMRGVGSDLVIVDLNRAEAIAALLSDLQPLECHVFCSLSEAMHEEYVPLGEAGEGGEERYSHYGEFQALIRKWINREVNSHAYQTAITSCYFTKLELSIC